MKKLKGLESAASELRYRDDDLLEEKQVGYKCQEEA